MTTPEAPISVERRLKRPRRPSAHKAAIGKDRIESAGQEGISSCETDAGQLFQDAVLFCAFAYRATASHRSSAVLGL